MIITGGKYKGRRIFAPDEKITRPTLSKVRMGVFNTLYSIMGDFEDKSFLDLFGGSGIMGLEALSRGFEEVLVIEKNPKAAAAIKKNYKTLKLEAELIIGDSLKLIEKITKAYDVIYIDPPYESGIYEKILPLIKTNSIVVVEHSTSINAGILPLKEKNYGGKKVSFFQFTHKSKDFAQNFCLDKTADTNPEKQ